MSKISFILKNDIDLLEDVLYSKLYFDKTQIRKESRSERNELYGR